MSETVTRLTKYRARAAALGEARRLTSATPDPGTTYSTDPGLTYNEATGRHESCWWVIAVHTAAARAEP